MSNNDPITQGYLDKVEATKLKAHLKSQKDNTKEVVSKLDELKPSETQRTATDAMSSFVQMLKGDKGDQGDLGNTGDVGEKGDTGKPGKDGKNGKDGAPGLNGLDGKDGVNGKDGTDGKDGSNGKDGSPDTAEQIVEKLQTIQQAWLELSQIKGLQAALQSMGNDFLSQAKGFVPKTVAGSYDVDVRNISNGQSLIWDSLKQKFVPGAATSTGGGTGFTKLTATGTVDGSNTAFTFTQKPLYVVSDGAWYVEGSGWSWSGSTATLDVPPQTGIWGFV